MYIVLVEVDYWNNAHKLIYLFQSVFPKNEQQESKKPVPMTYRILNIGKGKNSTFKIIPNSFRICENSFPFNSFSLFSFILF